MDNLPKPMLGEITAITITSPDLEKSLRYYQKLGFAEVMRFDFPFPWIQVSDGQLLMMVRLDQNPYIALTYYVKDIDNVVSTLEQAGIEFAQRPKPADMVKRYFDPVSGRIEYQFGVYRRWVCPAAWSDYANDAAIRLFQSRKIYEQNLRNVWRICSPGKRP